MTASCAPAPGVDPVSDAYLARHTQGTRAASRSADQRRLGAKVLDNEEKQEYLGQRWPGAS